MINNRIRLDHKIILNIISHGSRVLDIGCASGELLDLLYKKKKIEGQGIEINHANVEVCLKNGLSVVEGDANNEITNFPDNVFDYVILSQTLQTVEKPKWVLEQILRVGKRGIVSFPNFGYWKCRKQLFINGKMPVTRELEKSWYNTPNIHLCTIEDFYELASKMNINIEKQYGIYATGKKIDNLILKYFLNLFAAHGVFMISKKK